MDAGTGGKDDDDHERKCTPNTSLLDELTTDLKELGVSQADLVLLHEPCDTDADTIAAYAQLQQLMVGDETNVGMKPKARAIGVSNFNITLLELLLASNTTTVVPAVNQCRFSIGSHNIVAKGRSTTTLKFCQLHGITYEAYSPLGGLDGVDVLKDPDVQGGRPPCCYSTDVGALISTSCTFSASFPLLPPPIAIAKKHGVSPAQVALRWITQQGAVIVTSASKPAYMTEDLALFGFELSGTEMALLSGK
jgi:diketogulonate reductase-like aldo/keto reductase